MDIKINTRDAALVIGGLAAGFIAGSTLIKHAKKEIKKEIISSTTKTLKNEILADIKKEIGVNDIIDKITEDVNDKVVDNVLKESREDIKQFKKEVNKKIKDFNHTLSNIKDEVLNFDARIGKLLRNSITGVLDHVANRGDNDEIEIR